EDGSASFTFHAAGFLGADLIERLVHVGNDMKAVENVEGLGAVEPDKFQVRLPHVGTDETDFADDLFAHGSEESLEGFYGAFLADPEQTGHAQVDLVDQGQILVALGVLNLIDPDGVDLAEAAMFQPVGHNMLDCIKNLFP